MNPVPANFDHGKIDVHMSCKICNDKQENWICLTCYEVYCSRFVNNHMVEHFNSTKHSMVLSFSDLSIWCYACDSYVENDLLNEAKSGAYRSKFNE